ncbi:efflux transporter outer membrane subunit [Aquimarina sp. U1-2]|uniref:efflux transporter outer membrane subunit n=1 Tax=Aquimarina sp. U1-2 TaxID=2823141 RepID=UPI001AECB321|nr:efflux transporter outer membrane subunit [Aquimarina sp. U1-2]MBP2831040.1 efflux transporter outer membrane subunit [Aquimarina sp. U1-2]
MKNSIYTIVIALVLVSCGITKRDHENSVEINLEEDYLTANLNNNQFEKAAINQEWWRTFNDPILDTLIAKAKDHNLDIDIAVANFYGARAALKGTKFDRFPTVTLNGSYQRQRLGENVFIAGVNPTFNTYSGSFDAFWETDLFGRVTNRIKGAYANQQLALADMQDVYVSIFAEVTRNYMELRGIQYQLDIAQRNLDDQQETYDLTVRLTEAGTSNSLDVSRALAQLENTKATIPPLKAREIAIKNSLSVLLGEIPDQLNESWTIAKPLPSLPEQVLVGNGVDFLRRRPDVRRAEAALQVQIARYNISVAELYPNIQFGGSIGFSAINFSSFGENQAFTWSILPRISWAAFNLGRVKKQIAAEDAYTLAALAAYEKTVLMALEEIKTSMATYTSELERRELLRKSAKASQDAANFAQKRYTAGLDSFIDYLSADQTLLEAQNRLAISEINAATSLVAIYKALGGGWENTTQEELDEKFKGMKTADKSKR